MNILLTSVGRRTYMVQYFKNALNGDGLVHASNSIMTYSLKQADEYVLTPQIYEDNYISFLIDYCKKNKIKAIISLFDIDLPILSKNKSLFKENDITVIVSDFEAIQICNDKWLSYIFLKEQGLSQPLSYISIDKVINDINSSKLNFPIILKPRWGMGSIGIYEAENMDELDIFYKKLHREIFNTYLKHESKQDANTCIIIQEKIIGEEFGLDILNDLKGEYVTTIAKQKIAMRAGETDIAKIVDNTNFLNISQIISRTLKHIGNLDVDCFITKNRDIFVLEMNCRFGGQYPFSHLAGVNFPKQIISWVDGLPTDSSLIEPVVGIASCKDLNPVIFE